VEDEQTQDDDDRHHEYATTDQPEDEPRLLLRGRASRVPTWPVVRLPRSGGLS
jgi:hypothetical protein